MNLSQSALTKALRELEERAAAAGKRVQALGGAAALELEPRPGGVHETPGGQGLRGWRGARPQAVGRAARAAAFLFARRRPPAPNWSVWGNEIESDVSLAPGGYPVPSDYARQDDGEMTPSVGDGESEG